MSFNRHTHDFTQNKLSVLAASNRKVVHGFGVNDADYVTGPVVEGLTRQCPIYCKWVSMIRRCYSREASTKYPSYAGCTVCDEWRYFSAFRKWYVSQPQHEKYDLDKDIKVRGNKVYSPDTCLLVPAALNNFLRDVKGGGKHPVGAHWVEDKGKFKSGILIDGKRKHLGYFETESEAADAYWKAKSDKIQALIDSDAFPAATPFLAQHRMPS